MRGPDEQITALGLEYKTDEQSKDVPVLTQTFYGEGAAIPLGGGDFVLQITCSALVKDGKVYASWIGGKKSPYPTYTVYGTVAQDRKKGYGWANIYLFSARGDRSEDVDYADSLNLFFNKYRIKTSGDGSEGNASVAIIPSDIGRSAALSLFRRCGTTLGRWHCTEELTVGRRSRTMKIKPLS